MNTAPLLLLVAIAGLQTPDAPTQKPVTFSDPKLGLLFDHPPTWVVQKNKKGHAKSKSEQGLTVMTIPTTSSPTGATLEIYHAQFASTADTWQTVELRSNEQLHRTVDRQWQQDILGVPLLLTRISYTDSKTGPTTALTGLLYTRTHQKLLFRLTGPTADFDNVQYGFTTAMQTLRTVDGVMPKEEDPEHPLPPPKKTDPTPSARIPIVGAVKAPKYMVEANNVKLVVATKNVAFHFPKDWKVVSTSGTTVTIKSDDVSGPVTLKFYSTLDSDTPSTALLNLSSQDLPLFDSVSLRLDTSAEINKAGCTIETVWRTGKDAKGTIYMLQAAGQQGEYYFIADFKGTSADSEKDDKDNIQDFLKTVSIISQS